MDGGEVFEGLRGVLEVMRVRGVFVHGLVDLGGRDLRAVVVFPQRAVVVERACFARVIIQTLCAGGWTYPVRRLVLNEMRLIIFSVVEVVRLA